MVVMQSELLLNSRERNIEECGYPYKFSVVVPVYNTEQYLEETIDGIVRQTIGFEDNIQLILVNNATEDNAGEICERYQQLYPDNVVYVKLIENKGVCRARNVGKELAEGKYVNFLDSDDKWALAAFEKIYSYFELNYDEVDLVACRIKHFDASGKWHGLDRKFSRDQIISILDKYSYVQLSLCSTVIKQEIAKKYDFDERVRHAEDAKYITEILLERKCYALMRTVVFYYRTRKSGQSVLQTVANSYSWYFDTPIHVFKYLFDLSEKEFGYVLPYIQYLVMYEIQWRLKTDLPFDFSEQAKEEYCNIIYSLIRRVDDYIIWEQKNLWREYKLFALSIKYGDDVYKKMDCREGGLFFHNIPIYPAKTGVSVEVAITDIKDDVLYLEGRFTMVLLPGTYTLNVINNKDIYPAKIFHLDESAKRLALGTIIHEIVGFKVEIPLVKQDCNTVSFQLMYRGVPVNLGMHFSFICKLTQKDKNLFWCCRDYILKPENSQIEIYPYSKKKHSELEHKLNKGLLKSKKCKLLAWRLLISICKYLFTNSKKQIWLIMDSFNSADDNGEAFFKYVMQHKSDDIKAYYVVNKHSEDFSRLKKIGPVIGADTKKYRLMFAIADKVISAFSFYNNQNTFYDRTELLQDLFKFKFVYLQHGVIKDNHADTQSRHKKDFALFITSAKLEAESIIDGIGGNYCYDENVVKITGLARHDQLLKLPADKKKKKILLAPTWRKEGVGVWDESIQTYAYSDQFKTTQFFVFYEQLINDNRLLNILLMYGYKLVVRLHPRTIQQVSDFTAGDFVELEPERRSYYEEIAETSLLITDYSSIAFDYAYANIPVIYTQFDVNTFYLNHGYKRGYFDYETMGFGPVCYDYETTVQAIIKAIENDCVMEDKYKQRVDNFFAYRDGRNCERIYNEILKLGKE